METDIEPYDVICPKPAYDRLVKAGLDKKIKEKKRDVSNLLLFGFDEKIAEIIEKAKSDLSESSSFEKRRVAEEIVCLNDKLDEDYFGCYSDNLQRLTLEHPSLLAYLILGERIYDYEEFGFPNRRTLEESIASFCVGERIHLSDEREWVWRRDNFRFEISQNIHGDLYAGQEDVSGKDSTENGLFGEIKQFDTIKKRNRNFSGVFVYQDWSQFLVATLKYTREIGKDNIPGIVNWKDVLKRAGAVGTFTAEAFGGFHDDHDVKMLFCCDILTKNKKLKTFPLTFFGDQLYFIPYINEKKLSYLVEDEKGNVEINGQEKFFNEKKFRIALEYSEDDLFDILKATYRFFARDRTLLPKIMDYFLSEKQIP